MTAFSDQRIAASLDELELQSMALVSTLEIQPPDGLVMAGKQADGHLPPGFWRAYVGWSLGGNLFLCGDPSASEVLRQAAFDADIAGATVLTTNCLATSAIVTEFAGDGRPASSESARRITDLVATGDLEGRPPTAVIVAYASLVQARSDSGSSTGGYAPDQMAHRSPSRSTRYTCASPPRGRAPELARSMGLVDSTVPEL